MANLLKNSGPAPALLLLAAVLAAGARADDWATTAECKAYNKWQRVRREPVDSDANYLDMSLCYLTGVQEHALTGLPALTHLWLWGNELRELPVFEEHTCPNLTGLELCRNRLTSINSATFSVCTKLDTISLCSNQIEFIHHSVFTALTDLMNLDLRDNKIRYIPDQMFVSNGKLRMLYLEGNRITHLPPEFAIELKRAGAGLEVFYFDNNPWHCACLIELLADVRRAGVCYYNKLGVLDYNDYKKGAYDGTARVCAYTGAAPCCRRAPTGLLRPGEGGR